MQAKTLLALSPFSGPHGPVGPALILMRAASRSYHQQQLFARCIIIVTLWLFSISLVIATDFTFSASAPGVVMPSSTSPPAHTESSQTHSQREQPRDDSLNGLNSPPLPPQNSPQPDEPFTATSGAPRLPDCQTIDRIRHSRPVRAVPELVLVSTADGHVTAVDVDGRIAWRTDTGRPLLQASLKKITLDEGRAGGGGGGSATFIPSLDGSLYKFDGKQIEVVATADSVMYSSVKTDPWVLTGGRETKTFGIDPRTGDIRLVGKLLLILLLL